MTTKVVDETEIAAAAIAAQSLNAPRSRAANRGYETDVHLDRVLPGRWKYFTRALRVISFWSKLPKLIPNYG